ncbi:DUF402 domain-containing protein [Hathewaya histolytica]|uniref:Protein of uncharacterized function (DUF402) n=2 Tax=Hathewaya histolytica TaxID=1498 RepID=A0A4U9RPD0_HATHI|nr:Protein of uncharacterised function (DUF402) [Hathewaya histolytica]
MQLFFINLIFIVKENSCTIYTIYDIFNLYNHGKGIKMKVKYADHIKWNRILEKDFNFKYIDRDEFRGYAAISYFKKVTAPRYAEMNGVDYLILDEGHTWIQYFPEGLNYAVTVMFDCNKKIVQWYFDICTSNKIDERGIPYFNDLYLDVVLLPKGDTMLLDEDELEEALKIGDITEEEYHMAKEVAEDILKELKEDKNSIVHFSKVNLKEMQEIL